MKRKLVFADNEIVNDLIWRFAGLFGYDVIMPGQHICKRVRNKL